MPSVLNTTTSPRRGWRAMNVMRSMRTWSPAETAGAIARVGIENGRINPKLRRTVSAPPISPGISARTMRSFVRLTQEPGRSRGNGGGVDRFMPPMTFNEVDLSHADKSGLAAIRWPGVGARAAPVK